MKNRKSKFLAWSAIVACGCGSLLSASIVVASGTSGGGNGSNYNGCQSAYSINASTCYGLSWRYYNIPDDATGNITVKGLNGTGGDATVSGMCKEYGGGFYFLGFEAYGKADSWENASSLGYNVPKMSLGQFLTGETNNSYNRYTGGSDSNNTRITYKTTSGATKTGLTSSGGARDWDEVKTAYEEARTKYPDAFQKTGAWSASSTLIWFCANDDEPEPEPKTAYFEGRVEASVEVNGISQSGSAGFSSGNTSSMISIPVATSSSSEDDTELKATVSYNFYIQGKGDDTEATSDWTYHADNIATNQGTYTNNNSPETVGQAISGEVSLSVGSNSVCGYILFQNVKDAAEKKKAEVCIEIVVPDPEYNVQFYGDTDVTAGGDIKVIELEGLEDVVESTTPNEDGTYTIRSGVSLDGKTLKVLSETVPLNFTGYIKRIDGTTEVAKAKTYFLATPPEVSAFINPENVVGDISDAYESGSGVWDKIKGFFSNLITKVKGVFGSSHLGNLISGYTNFMTDDLSIGGVYNIPGASGDYLATSTVTEYCLSLFYIPTRTVNEDGTDTIVGKIKTWFGEAIETVSCLINGGECDFGDLITATGDVSGDVANKIGDAIEVLFSDDDTLRFESHSCVSLQQALNFEAEPNVVLNDDHVYAGEHTSISVSSEIVTTPYHEGLSLTKTSPLTVQLVHFTADPFTVLDNNTEYTDDADNICTYFSNISGVGLCDEIETISNETDGDSIIVYPYGADKAYLQFSELGDGTNWNIEVDDDAAVGTLVCAGVGVKTANSDAYLNGNKDTWSISVSCVPVAKKPSANIINGGAYFNGGASTSISSRNNISDFAYGSWVQYDIVAKGNVGNLASGSKLASGIASSFNICDLHTLTIANKNCTSGEAGNAGDGIEASNIYSNVVGTFTKLVDTHPTSDSDIDLSAIMTDDNYRAGVTDTYGVKTSGDVSIYSSMSDGALPSDNGRVGIIYVTGNARITSNLVFNDIDGTEIPQALIIADSNIYIDDSVTRIDAWLVAGGGIYTANEDPDGGSSSADVANQKLTIHGPIFANSIYLNRTGGADSPNYASTAETIDFAPTTYIWLYQWSKKTTTKLFIDTLTEMAPRY